MRLMNAMIPVCLGVLLAVGCQPVDDEDWQEDAGIITPVSSSSQQEGGSTSVEVTRSSSVPPVIPDSTSYYWASDSCGTSSYYYGYNSSGYSGPRYPIPPPCR